MDFVKYVFDLLITAFWNPNSPLFSVFGWLTAIYTIIVFAVPRMREHWENKVMSKVKPYRVLILSLLIFVSLVVSAYSLQSGGNIPSEHKPTLIFNNNTSVAVANDNAKQMTNIDLVFHIDNVGDRAAYQLFTRICITPAKHPQNILSYPDFIGTNPVQPHEEIINEKGITTPFTMSDNITMVESTVWYIYYQMKYSDKPKAGHWYSDEYWFALDLNAKRPVRDLSAEEKQIFEPIVNAHYNK